jgi:polysaccharide pyruvyl transferase WcaK-like protein
MTKSVAIYCSCGDSNVGDEAYWQSLGYNLQQIDKSIEIVVYSKDDTKSFSFIRNILKTPISEINSHKVLIIGGGHVIARRRSLLMELKGIIGKITIPIILVGAGMSDDYNETDKDDLKDIFRKILYFSVRNKKGKETIKLIDDTRYVDLVPDIVYGLPDDLKDAKFDFDVGIVPLQREGKYRLELIELIMSLIKQQKKVCLIDFYFNKTNYLISSLLCLFGKQISCISSKESYANEYIAILKKGKIIVAHRLHSIILSQLAGIPYIGYNYHPKITELVSDARIEGFNRKDKNRSDYEYDDVLFDHNNTLKLIEDYCGNNIDNIDDVIMNVKGHIKFIYEKFIQ